MSGLKSEQAKAASDEEVGAQILAIRGEQALAALSPEMRSVLETQAAHVVAQKMNDPANKQATDEAGISSKDVPEAAKTMVALFAGTVTATAKRPLSPQELAAGIADHIGSELSGHGTGTLAATPQPQITYHSAVRKVHSQAEDSQLKSAQMPKRSLYAIVAGTVSGAIAWFAAHVYAQDKMLDFEAEYLNRTVDKVTGRGGLGAAVAESGGGILGANFNGLGTGMNAGVIEEKFMTQLIREEPQKYAFAKWMRRIGGKSTFGMGVGVATGAAVGLATYALMKETDEPKKHAPHREGEQDWQSRTEIDKEQPRNLG